MSTQTTTNQLLRLQAIAKLRENILIRLIGALRDKGARSIEVQSLKLDYRNLESSIQLGLL